MLQLGNRKLGALIHSWSTPVDKTCPGASETCLSLCYARRGHYHSRRVQAALMKNLIIAKSKEFVPWMNLQLRVQFVRVLRVHAAGDFFNGKYIRNWMKILRANPQVIAFSYTRTWAVPEYFDAIVELGRQPNMQLWLSFDRDMAVPPRLKGLRRCYLAADDEDHPPQKVDLVFRNYRRTVMKQTKYRVRVCSYDNGITKTTCSKCGICWRAKHAKSDRNRHEPGRVS